MYLKNSQYKTEKQPKFPPNQLSSAQMSECSIFFIKVNWKAVEWFHWKSYYPNLGSNTVKY